jgi:hypothetical protein
MDHFLFGKTRRPTGVIRSTNALFRAAGLTEKRGVAAVERLEQAGRLVRVVVRHCREGWQRGGGKQAAGLRLVLRATGDGGAGTSTTAADRSPA